jgi:glycosyltransferase involved in cell wall biosynthesis
MNEPLVTIGIPTYNRADSFLKGALESALSQTYDNIEIIISDNCSSDHTERLVRSYSDTRIRYYKQNENIGPWRNMNYCLSAARGVYFLMLHDDDLIDTNLIQKCLDVIQYKTDKGIIIAGAREIDNEGNIIAEKPNHCHGMSTYEFLMEWYKKNIVLFLCSILFNTQKLKEMGGFKEHYLYYTDVAAEFELISKTERVDVMDVLGSFRVNIGSFGKKARVAQWCDDALKLLELGCSLVNHDDENGILRKVGMRTSAEWMYNEALRADRFFENIMSFFIVWSKFNYLYYPTWKQLFILFPPCKSIISSIP